ncbi:helix-turn-helix transcriptional regulator [Pseudorhodoplanes sp.]|uniref:helix-turn-helix transcriptional regulator n=1 Tax=Pseudorhodoplanes sp. TaxID=1934341 RepID=UPI003919CEEB
MTTKHLNQYELAKRWSISQRTLERWRWKRKGPPYLKIGGRVVYELDAIEAFECARRRITGDQTAAEASSR